MIDSSIYDKNRSKVRKLGIIVSDNAANQSFCSEKHICGQNHWDALSASLQEILSNLGYRENIKNAEFFVLEVLPSSKRSRALHAVDAGLATLEPIADTSLSLVRAQKEKTFLGRESDKDRINLHAFLSDDIE